MKLKYKTAPKSTIKVNSLGDLSIEKLYSISINIIMFVLKGLFDILKIKTLYSKT